MTKKSELNLKLFREEDRISISCEKYSFVVSGLNLKQVFSSAEYMIKAYETLAGECKELKNNIDLLDLWGNND
jgi:hypothetical protein